MADTNGVVQGTNGTTVGDLAAQGVQMPPLVVSGLVVTKADLVRALAFYVPHIVNIDPIEGDRFVLTVDVARPHTSGVTHD